MNIDRSKICPKCSYDSNVKGAVKCIICSTKLVNKDDFQPLKSQKTSTNSKQIKNLSNNQNKPNHSKIKELQKPINLIGIFIAGFGLFSWANYLFFNQSQEQVVVEQQDTVETVTSFPKGLFNYGGASIFAPLVASGINAEAENAHPGFELRYTKPLDQDFSSDKGIKMLLNGELSFAFNDRSLTDTEYQKAKLRGIELKQIPLGIDGVVLLGNIDTAVFKLNREQVKKIFTGEINNWRQIDAKAQNLPIVPVVVSNENYQALGIENSLPVAPSTQYSNSYTQALRKVIATPGSISFASASLVKNQRLIKIFDLAEGESSNYIKPFVNSEPNLEAFKKGTYPLTRRIFLVTRGDETLERQAGLAYANFITSSTGQKIVKKAGFVPLY